MPEPSSFITLVIAFGAFIAATIGIIISTKSYLRTKKSEQFKIAREIVDKVEEDFRKAFELDPKNTWSSMNTDEKKRKFVYDYLILLGFMIMHIRYLSHLVKKKQIENEGVLDFYRPYVKYYLEYVGEEYGWVEKDSQQRSLMAKWPGYHEDIPRLKHIWE